MSKDKLNNATSNYRVEEKIKDTIAELKKILKQKNINGILPHYIARYAKEFGFLDDVAYRNICINLEFKELRNNGFRVFDCKEYLAKKYTISEDSVHTILYR